VDEHDEHHFNLESKEESDVGWSSTEEERTFGAVRDLLMEMRGRGAGVFIRPVREDEAYGVEGWVVGKFSADGAEDLAVGPWLEQVVEAARAASG
jgi:hypothetical protein